jgi:hypothetical protein
MPIYTISKPTIKKQGIYTPFATPNNNWDSISMDYMCVLPSTKHGNECVFVIVDQFSKMAIFTPYKKSIIFEATVNLFFEIFWVHFELPHIVISDHDRILLCTF